MIHTTSDVSILEAAHRDHLTNLPGSTLFLLAHVTTTGSDAATATFVLMHPVSWQHLSGHLGMITSLKFAVWM